MKKLLCAAALACPLAAHAEIEARFIEGAPKDRFVLRNVGDCAHQALDLTLSIGESAGRLIFDVTDQGAGVEVFQPLEIVAGAALLDKVPTVKDGDNALQLAMASWPAGAEFSFTIDVDDTVSNRQITVTGSEIEGARLVVGGRSTRFGSDAVARVRIDWPA